MATPTDLRRLYEVERWTLAEVAAHARVSTKVARQLLEDAGTTMRNPGPSRPHELDDQAWLSAAYSNASLEQIAAELGCSPTTVARALERCGITRRRSGPR